MNFLTPKVTIGICVKNGGNVVAGAIESILRQDFPLENVEVIFVDDGSTDDTLQIIHRYLPKMHMRTRVFHHDWKGLGYSRNVVVKNAMGDYILWVDADMVLMKDFVRKQVEFMEKNPDVAIAKGRYALHHESCLVAFLQNVDSLMELMSLTPTDQSQPLGTGGAIYRTEAIRKIGGFDNKIVGVGEDMDAEYRVRKLGWQLKVSESEFCEKRRNSWRALWSENFWHGSGGRRILNKVSPHVMLLRMFPPTILLNVISRSCKAYKLTHNRVVFMLPLHWFYRRTAWFLGFLMSNT